MSLQSLLFYFINKNFTLLQPYSPSLISLNIFCFVFFAVFYMPPIPAAPLGTDCQDCGPVGADNFTRSDDKIVGKIYAFTMYT